MILSKSSLQDRVGLFKAELVSHRSLSDQRSAAAPRSGVPEWVTTSQKLNRVPIQLAGSPLPPASFSVQRLPRSRAAEQNSMHLEGAVGGGVWLASPLRVY